MTTLPSACDVKYLGVRVHSNQLCSGTGLASDNWLPMAYEGFDPNLPTCHTPPPPRPEAAAASRVSATLRGFLGPCCSPAARSAGSDATWSNQRARCGRSPALRSLSHCSVPGRRQMGELEVRVCVQVPENPNLAT